MSETIDKRVAEEAARLKSRLKDDVDEMKSRVHNILLELPISAGNRQRIMDAMVVRSPDLEEK